MDAYRRVMAKHLSNGYIEEVPNIDQPWPEEGCHYLPQFFVLKRIPKQLHFESFSLQIPDMLASMTVFILVHVY